MSFGLTLGLGGKHIATPDFSPAGLAGLSLWLDGADISTFIQTGGYVSQWSDKSGHGRHATQSSGASQPVTGSRMINGRNVLDFDGTDDFLNLPSSLYPLAAGNNHLFIVCARDVLSSEHRPIFGLSASAQGWGLKLQSGSGAQQQYFHGTSPMDVGTLSNTLPHVYDGYRDGSGIYGRMNQGAFVAGVSSNFILSSFTIGCRPGGTSPLNGVIAEIIVFNRALSVNEREKISSYLKTKWGTP